MKQLKKFWKKIKRFFTGSVAATGSEKMFTMNRKQRRANASIERKRSTRNAKTNRNQSK